MRKIFLLLLLCPFLSFSQAVKKVVVLGSSTAEGYYATDWSTTGWAGQFRTYMQTINPSSTLTNFGYGGFWSEKLMPNGFSGNVDTNRNITKAISLHPDIIIVNLSSNDQQIVIPIDVFMSRMRLFKKMANDSGIVFWATTTQPRNTEVQIQAALAAARDSIMVQFPSNYIDFYTGMGTNWNLNEQFNSGDGVHFNQLGHDSLAQKVIAANILNVTLNASPIVNAGSDQSFNYLTTSTSVTAIASDAEGSSLTYAWTQISGTAATIASPSSATTSITSIGTGTSVFRCTVSDGTTTAFDDVSITRAANTAPTANAGTDKTISFPNTATSLSGTGSDGETSVTYVWTQVSGVAATITNSTSATATITGLTTPGTYIFRLTVSDGLLTTTDDVTVTVVAKQAGLRGRWKIN